MAAATSLVQRAPIGTSPDSSLPARTYPPSCQIMDLRPNAHFQRRSMMRVPPMRACSLRVSVKSPWRETPQVAVSLSLCYRRPSCNRAGAWPRPRGAALISASTDLALTGESIEARADADPLSAQGSLSSLASLYLAGHDPRDPLASPLYGDLAGLPPVMMHVGEDDILLDDCIRYAERLERGGGTTHLHIWAGMIYVFPSNLALLQAANEALDNIGHFLKQQLSGDA